jgi:hypothetical protein
MPIFEDPLVVKQAYMELSGSNIEAPAPLRKARIWYDDANAVLKFSVNGGAFSENPGALSLQDLTAHVLTTAPTASGAAAVLRLDTGTFAGSANGTMLGINLHTGTADLLNLQKAGADRFKVSETGIATVIKAVIGGTTAVGQATITSTDAAIVPLIVRAATASPTANWFEIQNSAGTQTLVSFGGSSPFFNVGINAYGFFYGGQISTLVRMGATADTTTAIPICAKGIAGQTADLFQARASTDAVLFAIAAAGHPTLGEGINIIAGTTTGTKIGTATSQKLGFFNATPVIQQTLAAAATDAATTQTLANSLRTALINLGLGA